MTRRHSVRSRRGVALLEVLIAATLLTTLGAAWIVLALQTTRSIDLLGARELETRHASEALHGLSTLAGNELMRLMGTSRIKGLDVTVASVDGRRFTVVVTDTLGGAVILDTSLYPNGGAGDAP